MKAIRIHEFGGAEKLRYDDAPMPELQPASLLIQVHAASVNPVDLKLAADEMHDFVSPKLPWTPGADFAGTVESFSAGVTEFQPGDAVYGSFATGSPGAYAEYVTARADTAAAKPRNLNFVDAASIPIVGQTAWQGLFEHGQLQRGQTVLIHGASGGVGSMAVQLALWKGAKVIATASAKHLDFVQSLGADKVIDYNTSRFEESVKDVDVVFDVIGKETQQRSFGVLREGGRLISTVQVPSKQEASARKIHAMMMHMHPSRGQLQLLAGLLEEGRIKPNVTKTFPLEKAREAWAEIKDGHTRGKLVLQVAKHKS